MEPVECDEPTTKWQKAARILQWIISILAVLSGFKRKA